MIVPNHQLQELRRHLGEEIVVELFLPVILLAGGETCNVPFEEDGTDTQALKLLSCARRINLDSSGRFRGDRFFFGAVPLYGAYTYYYSSCDYYYERAVATGSGYWWDRYYACTGDY